MNLLHSQSQFYGEPYVIQTNNFIELFHIYFPKVRIFYKAALKSVCV